MHAVPLSEAEWMRIILSGSSVSSEVALAIFDAESENKACNLVKDESLN